MQELFLLRHGAYNEGESVLNEQGIIQAIHVLKYIKNKTPILTIYSSSGPRAIQTASFIAEEFGVSVQVVPWLEKTVDFQELNLKEKAFENTDSDHVLLVCSGEYIHQYIEEFSVRTYNQNPLRPLVKGEMILCCFTGSTFSIKYF